MVHSPSYSIHGAVWLCAKPCISLPQHFAWALKAPVRPYAKTTWTKNTEPPRVEPKISPEARVVSGPVPVDTSSLPDSLDQPYPVRRRTRTRPSFAESPHTCAKSIPVSLAVSAKDRACEAPAASTRSWSSNVASLHIYGSFSGTSLSTNSLFGW